MLFTLSFILFTELYRLLVDPSLYMDFFASAQAFASGWFNRPTLYVFLLSFVNPILSLVI